jgi:transketolase
MIYSRKQGHTGGAFSIIEIMISLFYKILKNEDKFILSKGHSCVPYFLLLREKGFNPSVAGHPEIDPENGIFCTTGSLGHGLPTGIGMAMAKKLRNDSGKIYVLMSDAECQEGTTWESSLIANHHKLDNLVVIVDNNKKQTLGYTKDILSLEDLGKKFEAFNWEVRRINGHSFEELINAISKPGIPGKPLMIVADTIKGKGVKFMESDPSGWHNAIPSEEQQKEFLKELS